MRAVWVAVAMAALARPVGACEPLDPHALGWPRTFVEDFAGFDAARPGRWQTSFVWGGRFIPTNGELQVYVDPAYAGAGLNPFANGPDGLAIVAAPLDGAARSRIAHGRYSSGLLTSAGSFLQTYGYFEIRARLPAGRGLWPAFWLLQADGKWPPEIDVFEAVGQLPRRIQMSVHSAASGRHWSKSQFAEIADATAGFHDYGVLWTRDRLVWYHDRCPVAELPTPADLHDPMYMLVNLAVGGLAGRPDPKVFPARVTIQRILVYALPPSD